VNRQEQRTLRAIEKNLAVDNPALAELLRSSGRRRRRWLHRSAGALAVLFMLLAVVLGDVVLMLTAGLLALGAVLAWAVQAVQSDERVRCRR
jgi:peptidoglycan/LPS O-acetylase OafA/YrhL